METNGTDTLWYYYDASGSLTGFELNGTSYFYVKNLQGDIIAIVNSSGTKVVEYLYDSWGKLISTTGSLASTVGSKNPYRYRGYRYDTETGLYYLQSRYYDPLAKRFVNADGYASTGQGVLGNNMYAYCGNNPVNFIDPIGAYKINMLQHVLHDCSKPIIYEENVMERWEKKGVIFTPNSDGNGGKISNSYLITEYDDIYEYAYYLLNVSKYRDCFSGSVEGVLVEWQFHNFIYTVLEDTTQDQAKLYSLKMRAMHVDLGKTIFYDSHGIASVFMWLHFKTFFPEQYSSDFPG